MTTVLTSSSQPRRSRSVCTLMMAFVLTIFCQPLWASANAWNLDQLMQQLAAAKSGRVTFVEQKHIAMLDRPVESSGEMRYTAPDRLEKVTIKPRPETMLVEGNDLTIQRGSKKYALQLSDYPELAGFLDSIRGTLAGDRVALERSYKLKLDGAADGWILSMSPIQSRMAKIIHLIRITGNFADVRGIEIIQSDGDRSVMTMERIAVP